jgi:sugar phosphate isomerase/epimerase
MQATGVATFAGAGRAAATPRPKIGCTSWCFHGFHTGDYPDKAIDLIGEMGFDGIELILNTKEDIDKYWGDPKTIDRLKKQLERNKLEISQFVLFHPIVAGLTSTNEE